MGFAELVELVARDSAVSRIQAASVLRSFAKVVRKELGRGGRVILPSFGSFFTVKTRARALFNGTRRATGRSVIRFKESRVMDKYAVVLEDETGQTKEAQAGKGHCPKCGTATEHANGVQWCPKCGFEPFEKKPSDN